MSTTKLKVTKNNYIAFLPWFLSKRVHLKVERLLPHVYHKRLFKYFQLYGCISCQTKKRMCYSNGLCRNCSTMISSRLRRCDRLMAEEYREAFTPPSNELLRKITSARSLLSDLAGKKQFLIPKARGCPSRPQVVDSLPSPLTV
jgi:hypothetical protein